MARQNVDQTTLIVNGFLLNLTRASLLKDDEEIHLTPKECKLLALLMQNAGQVVSRKRLMEQVWDTNYLGDTRTLDVHICWLRQKVEQNPKMPRHIVTKRGQGYLLKA
ncbi:MAG: winged helix-turn-helix domain-containing protein [Anaerolineae bacterium]